MRPRVFVPPCLCLLFLGCGVPLGAPGGAAPPLLDQEKSHKGEPVTAEEKMVADAIQASKRKDMDEKITFLRWGPHDYSGYTHIYDPNDLVIIRVVCESRMGDQPGEPPTYHDVLYAVGDPAIASPLYIRPDYVVVDMKTHKPPLVAAQWGIPNENDWNDNWREEKHKEKMIREAAQKEAERKAKGD